jgi:hypothetical protein
MLLFIAFPRQQWLGKSASTLRKLKLFSFSDISFKCFFTSIGKEGSCTEDLIDQDAEIDG